MSDSESVYSEWLCILSDSVCVCVLRDCLCTEWLCVLRTICVRPHAGLNVVKTWGGHVCSNKNELKVYICNWDQLHEIVWLLL